MPCPHIRFLSRAIFLRSADCEGTGGIKGHISESCAHGESIKGAARATLLQEVFIVLLGCMDCKQKQALEASPQLHTGGAVEILRCAQLQPRARSFVQV